MIGMAGIKNEKTHQKPEKRPSCNRVLSNEDHVEQPRNKRKSIKIDHEFFKEFIDQDIDFLDQKFSEEQLFEIAQQLDDPQNAHN